MIAALALLGTILVLAIPSALIFIPLAMLTGNIEVMDLVGEVVAVAEHAAARAY